MAKRKKKRSGGKEPSWKKGLRAARRARKAAQAAGKKRKVSGYTRKQKKCRVKRVAVRAYRSSETKPRRRSRRRGNCKVVCKPLTAAQRTARRRAAGRKAAATRRRRREVESDRERHLSSNASEGRRRRRGRRSNPMSGPKKRRSGRRPTKKQLAALARGRRKNKRIHGGKRRRSSTKRRRKSGRRRSGMTKHQIRVAAGRKAARTRKRRRSEGRRRGRRDMVAYERRGRRHHRRGRRRGRRENPFSAGEVLVGTITALFGFASADILDRWLATHTITASGSTDAQGHALYTDTPPSTGSYPGLFNGAAVVAPMDWKRWLGGGVLTLVPMGLAFWPVKGTSPMLRSTLQTYAFGAGVRWLGKGLQDLVSALLSFTCFGQQLYDPEIRGRALVAVKGNTADPSVTGFPSTGLGRRLAPAYSQVPRMLGPKAPLCTGCGKPRTGTAGCCSIVGCCPQPLLPASTTPGQSPPVAAPPGQQPFTATVSGVPAGIAGRPNNIFDWGNEALQ